MALLTRYAMQNKTYQKIAGTKKHKAPNPTENWDREWKNKNRLLSKYKYTTGGKTGYTKRAKRTLVSTATKGDMSLIAVTLNAPDDWNDHIAMYENGFKTYDMVEVLSIGKIDIKTKKVYHKHLYLKNSVVYPATNEEMDLFSIKYKLNEPGEDWEDSDHNGEAVGKAQVYLDGKVVRETPIYYQGGPEKKKGLFDSLKSIFLSVIGVKLHG
jgi:serine-type D-Ala-D-Ala carboxypeptidase (penicillin-binding protein 5/6)